MPYTLYEMRVAGGYPPRDRAGEEAEFEYLPYFPFGQIDQDTELIDHALKGPRKRL
jgi:hypothetical protein